MTYDATDFVVTEVPAPVRDPKSITDPRERVAYLRDFLRERATPHTFCMSQWHCGSAACIGGWIDRIWGEGNEDDPMGDGAAGDLIGLADEQVWVLFYPGVLLSDGTKAIELEDPKRAANVLTNYLATGNIDWSVA